MSPTARSLAELRVRVALAGVVERWNPGARVRQDFLGFADILAVEPDRPGVLAVQACATGDQSKRLTKLATEPVRERVAAWLAAGNRLAVWGWAKRGSRGQRKRWTLSETAVDGCGRPQPAPCSSQFRPTPTQHIAVRGSGSSMRSGPGVKVAAPFRTYASKLPRPQVPRHSGQTTTPPATHRAARSH